MEFPVEDNFTGEVKTKFLEQEITRLQELCRINFATIDDLKKQNGKLLELQIELKETTSDLAYSLAEYPWWKEENLSVAVRILATFTQKIQYILELPTFIDPVEQLEKNGRYNDRTIKKIINQNKNYRNTQYSNRKFKCLRCKRLFVLERNFSNHKDLHKQSTRAFFCQCGKIFPAYLLRRHKTHECKQSNDINQYVNSVQNSHRNLKIRKYVKCAKCQASFFSARSYYEHLKRCTLTLRWPRNLSAQSIFNNPFCNTAIQVPPQSRRRGASSYIPENATFPGHQPSLMNLGRERSQKSPVHERPLINVSKSGDSFYDLPSQTNDMGLKALADNNDAQMLNCSISNLIKRGFKVTVHNSPSTNVSYTKNIGSGAFTAQSNMFSNNFDAKTYSSNPQSVLSNVSEYNVVDDSQSIYKCSFCEFRTHLKHLLEYHNTSKCRWRHFLADQVPFLKTVRHTKFHEKKAYKFSTEDCQSTVEMVHTQKSLGGRQRSATL